MKTNGCGFEEKSFDNSEQPQRGPKFIVCAMFPPPPKAQRGDTDRRAECRRSDDGFAWNGVVKRKGFNTNEQFVLQERQIVGKEI